MRYLFSIFKALLPLIICIFEGVRPLTAGPPDNLYLVYKKGRAGYINSRGNMRIKPAFRRAGFESVRGLVIVAPRDLYGYMNAGGTFVITPRFKQAFPFREGLARVKYSDGKFGYIKQDGTPAFSKRFVRAFDFHEGRAMVVEKNTDGWEAYIVINKRGQRIGKHWRTAGNKYSEGLALVMRRSYGPDYPKGIREWGYIDRSGAVKHIPRYQKARPFSEGLAAVGIYGYRWGFINHSGKLVIPERFAKVSDFKGGLAIGWLRADSMTDIIKKTYRGEVIPSAYLHNLNSKGHFPIIIDAKGRRICKKYLLEVGEFAEGLAPVGVARTSGIRRYYMDRNCRLVFAADFDENGGFSEGLAAVRRGTKWGFINRAGKLVVAPRFDSVSKFNNGVARVCEETRVMSACNQGKIGYINSRGEFIWKPTYTLEALNSRAQERMKAALQAKEIGIRTKHIRALTRFLKLGAEPGPLLGDAVGLGELTLVRLLVEMGVDLNSRDRNENFPIQYAVQNRRLAVLDYLLSRGARLEIPGIFNVFSELVEDRKEDAAKEDLDLYRALLKKGARVQGGAGRVSPLFYGAEAGFLNFSRFLVENGADVNALTPAALKHKPGQTALMGAVQKPWALPVVKYLLDNGARRHIKDAKGRTALMLAASIYRNQVILKYLISRGSGINVQDHKGWSPLFFAVSSGGLESVKVLVQSGANIRLKDISGNDVLKLKSDFSRFYHEEQNVKDYLKKIGRVP